MIKFSEALKLKSIKQGLLYLFVDPWYRMNWFLNKETRVKDFLSEQVELIRKLDVPIYAGSNDEKIVQIQKWVQDNITYKSDYEKVGIVEYWQNVEETFKSRSGDCEDGAVLIYAMAIKNKIPPYLLTLWAGDAVERRTNKTLGHACCKYKSDNPLVINWYAMDWCWYPTRLPLKNRPVFEVDPAYSSTWFEVNHLDL